MAAADRATTRRRGAALGALAAALAAAAAGALLGRSILAAGGAALLFPAAAAAGWEWHLRRGRRSLVAGAFAAAALWAGALILLIPGGRFWAPALLPAVLAALSVLLAGFAVPSSVARPHTLRRRRPSSPPLRPVLLLNRSSGGGKVEELHLEEEALSRGIRTILTAEGDDLARLANQAVAEGADALGMAGGDGSQAAVAAVAAKHRLPYVCVPAGTRNNFARDLGLDVSDVLACLDAYAHGVERRIDMAWVEERPFLNNVSLGVYGRIVQSPEYREAKLRTAARMLPKLLGPEAPPFDLTFAGPDGVEQRGVQVLQVSNNPYDLESLGGFASRPRLDSGRLGIVAVRVQGRQEVLLLATLETAGRLKDFPGWRQWTAASFTVDSPTAIDAGVDGEAAVLTPPLAFRIDPRALRVLVPRHASLLSPAAEERLERPAFRVLFEAARGR